MSELILYARQLAWLRSKPQPRQTKNKKQRTAPLKTRAQTFRDLGLEAKMPEIELCPHVADWFEDVGPASNNGMGVVPLSYGEIESWLNVTNLEVTSFEVDAMMMMSRQYCYQSVLSEDEKCEQPYKVEYEQDELAAMRQKADEHLRGLW